MSIYDKASLVQIPSGYKASGAKLYSVLPANGDGDFTVSSDADATRVNSDGLVESTAANQARLNYDPSNPQDPHLLLEPTRTNLQVRSEEFDNADWTKSNCTVSSNQITSPDGATTADRLTGDTSTGNHYVQDVASGLSTSSEATLSVFVKKDEITQIELLAAQNTSPYTNWGRLRFDLDTLTTFQTPIGEYGYEDYGNGWIRLFITGTPTSTSAIIRFTLYKNDTSGWTGNDIDGFYLWGAQLEQGNYPTSYIPTTSAAVTRTEDFCHIPSGLQNVLNTSEGTLFVDVEVPRVSTTSDFDRIVLSDQNSSTDRLIFDNFGGNWRTLLLSSGNNVNQTIVSVTANQRIKVAIAYSSTQLRISYDGNAATTTSGTYAPTTTLESFKFSNKDGGSKWQGKIYQAMYFNTALSDSELQTLTS